MSEQVVNEKTSYDVIRKAYTEVEALSMSEDTVIAYQGVPGAFGEQATITFFGKDKKTMAVESFEKIIVALEKGEADYGVLPVENSSAGFVSGNYNLLGEHDVAIVAEMKLTIHQSLLGLPGATVKDIKRIYSHPQGLLQSRVFLEQYNWEQISFANTAMAAKKVKEDGDIHQGAIASVRAAELYGLDVIEPCTNFADSNATRFLILTKEKVYTKKADKICIQFDLAHKSGTLYNILGFFYHNGINMTSIESVPLPGRPWEYHFIVTIDGSLNDKAVEKALAEVCNEASSFRLLGNYY